MPDAEFLPKLRAFLIEQGRSRGDIRFDENGKPRYQDFADRLGVSKGTISKIFRGLPDQRPGVLKPRRDFYAGSHELFEAIGAWLNMDSEQVQVQIKLRRGVRPFKTRGR